VDWAIEVARLLEGRYTNCPQVILVSDNLNTHTKGKMSQAQLKVTVLSWG
jgi:hypothetical protein